MCWSHRYIIIYSGAHASSLPSGGHDQGSSLHSVSIKMHHEKITQVRMETVLYIINKCQECSDIQLTDGHSLCGFYMSQQRYLLTGRSEWVNGERV